MILSDSLSQPYALLVFSLVGLAFGALYMLNWFVCSFLIKSGIYRHLSQILYTLLYGACIFFCVLTKFEYNIHSYYLFIALFASLAIGFAIYIPLRKYRSAITEKCTAFTQKISQSEFVKKLKK